MMTSCSPSAAEMMIGTAEAREAVRVYATLILYTPVASRDDVLNVADLSCRAPLLVSWK